MSNISRSIQDNQAIKFRQLIQYNMRNIFVEISYRKFVGETILRGFKIEHISGLMVQSFIEFFLLYAKLRAIKMHWNYAADH